MPLPLRLYRFITSCLHKWLVRFLNKRVQNGKEDPKRLKERMGFASSPRPAGHLTWFHAASIGEAQSVLILLKKLHETYPDMQFLITTGTLTSANLLKKRLPKWAIHQFYPLDHPRWVKRFLDHWKPDIAIWVESELWPNMLLEIKKRPMPLALVNARMSKRSLRRWSRMRKSAHHLLNIFDLFLTQTDQDAIAFKHLGARSIYVTDSLKYAADPLPADQDNLIRFQKELDTRRYWLFASSHDGEEDIAMDIHANLKAKFPTLLTMIAPRDPKRADSIMALAQSKGLKIHQRSENPVPPDLETDIYLIDTFGELGLFYALNNISCIGGSFSLDNAGGHNPIEAAQLNCAILHGPMVQNANRIYDEMNTAMAAIRCENKDDLKQIIARLLLNPENIIHLQDAAQQFIDGKSHILDDILKHMKPLITQAGMNCPPPETRQEAENGQALRVN